MSDRLKTRLETLRELTRMTETDKPDEFPPEEGKMVVRYGPTLVEQELRDCRKALAVPEGESLLDHIRAHLAEHDRVSKALQSKGLDELAAEGQAVESSEDIEFRLRERARIRREIPNRKSVQEGKPDRIADLLDEAANIIRWYREMYEDSRDQADRYVCEVNAASALLSLCQSYLDSPHFPHPGEKCKELKAKLQEALGPVEAKPE